MKKNNSTKLICWKLLFVIFQVLNLHAQNNISVLRMDGISNHTNYFDTNIGLKSMLLDKGTNGAATVEFWGKFQNNTQSLILTTDAQNELGLDLEVFRNNIIFKSPTLTDQQAISTPATITEYWQHFAFVFYKIDNENNYSIDVYADGEKVKTFSSINIGVDADIYFTKGNSSNEVYLAEIKAWNVKRSDSQINANRFTSFYNYVDSAIDDQISLGLVANYSGTALTQQNEYVNELTNTYWNNTIQQVGYPSYGKIVSKIESANLTKNIATINNTMGNPIEELDQIIVEASRGAFDDKVEIKWFHIEELVSYSIFRDNIQIDTYPGASGATGAQLIYTDEEALPGTLYTYKIEGVDTNNSPRVGRSTGFIFPNGTVSGNIKTQSTTYVEGVGVQIVLDETEDTVGINGTALSFNTDSDKITFLDTQLFTDNNDITIEFWYKNNAESNDAPENTLFKLGTTEILMGTSHITLNYNNFNSSAAFTLSTSDNEWHHYTCTLAADGVQCFQDGESIGIYNIPFSWETMSVDFNYYLNYAVNYNYSLDEFRVWKGKKEALDIKNTYPFVVDSDHEDLLIAYSMDLKGANEIYNRAEVSKGSYLGKTDTALVYEAQNTALQYLAYTNDTGDYEFSSIYSNKPTGNSFTATAFKPNHDFRPQTVGLSIKQSSLVSDYSKIADFTDISELPVSGKILYHVYNEQTSEEELYPVPAGKQIAIDGTPVVGTDDSLISDAFGVFSISASLDANKFEIYNPELDNNLILNSLSFSPVEEEDTITSDGYAVSNKTLNYEDEGITFSGYVNPYLSVVYPDYVAVEQTLMQWGNFKVVLSHNELLQFWYEGSLQKEVALTNQNDFNFFALSVDPLGNYGFMVEENYQAGLLSNVTFGNHKWYVGAQLNSDDGSISEDNLSNLALLEYRKKAYNDSQLLELQEGGIIANDEDVLELSFDFAQEKGSKALSKTLEGKNNYLALQGNAIIDAAEVLSYTGKYQYEYEASNSDYNPKEGSSFYELNVVDPITSLNFEMKDRYGFIGNIVIPCDYNIGTWQGTITRTDSTSPLFEKTINAANFNADNTIFLVDNLLPGYYQITLTNIEDSSIELVSPIVDLTKGWGTYDFEYRAPIVMDVNLFVVKEEKAALDASELTEDDFEQQQTVCNNDFYVLGEGNPVVLQVEVYEEYGGEKCMLEDAEVTFSGALMQLGSSSITNITDAEGHTVLDSYAAAPNFIAPHTKNFTISVSHNSRYETQTIKGLVAGARMNASDFTIADPIVNFVLHDPPGDGSFATLSKGATSTTTTTLNASYGKTKTTSIGVGSEYSQSVVVTPFGVGTSVEITDIVVNNGVSTEFSRLSTYSESETTQIVNSTEISTSSSDNLVGKYADVFVGTGYLITVGYGQTLTYNTATCSVDYNEEAEVSDNRIDNFFVHTYYNIKTNLLPNLFSAIKDETDTKQIESLKNSIIRWIEVLAHNDLVLNSYNRSDYDDYLEYDFVKAYFDAQGNKDKLPEVFNESEYDWEKYPSFKDIVPNTSFDGGGTTITESITTANTKSNGEDSSYSFNLDREKSAEASVNAFSTEFSYSSTIDTSFGVEESNENTNEVLIEYTLSDDDASDQFAIEIKRDPNYAVPIFKTLAGQSSCPAERNTQIKTGVELEAETNIADGLTGETLTYKVLLRNTQIADATTVSYDLNLSAETNPKGALVQVNGASMNGGSPVSFYFGEDENSPTGVVQELEAEITITTPDAETSSAIEYKDLEFVFSVSCENHDDIAFSHNADVYEEAGIKSVDFMYLTASFNGPCITGMEQESPQENWVVNASSNNQLDFTFTIPGTTFENNEILLPDTLTAIEIEYALEGNNTPKLFYEIDVDELKTLYSENAFRLPLDVSSLVDGNYGFRLVPVCGIGTEVWRRNIPTDYAYGMISRNAPLLLETNPKDGGVLTEGSIIATYNSALDPATLNPLNISLKGVLGGYPSELISADFSLTDQITIPHGDFLNIEDEYTIEFWINPTAYPTTNNTILDKGSNYFIGIQPNGKLNYSNNINAVTGTSLPLQQWTHVAVVYDGATTLNIYFNGELVFSDTGFNISGNDLLINDSDLLIGGDFIGQLDELRVWNTMRTHADIVTNIDKQLWGTEEGLVAYYVFDENALEVNGYQEAIYDFTGNTSGSSDTGIAWVYGNDAAPLDKSTKVVVVEIEVTTNIDNNQIIINPSLDEYYLEGAKLTASFNGNNIKGVDGNTIESYDWSFTINKNSVQWEKTNISVSQTLGNAVTFDMLVSNTGGADATYELQELPEWLKCSTTSVGSSQDLDAGFEQKLTFTTSAYLNKGTENINIGVISYDTDGIQTGYEYFALELTVDCEVPDYPLNTNNFAAKKEFVGQLIVDSQFSTDVNDLVVAYFNDEVRGVGKLTTIGDQQFVFLDVFYNVGESGNLEFKVWDDSDCKEYTELTAAYYIGDDSFSGSITSPVSFETGNIVVKRIPLLKGYQWVSFNTISNTNSSNLQISNIKGMTTGDQIMELDGEAIASFNQLGVATGTLTHLDFTKAYQVYAESDKLMLVEGAEASLSTDIPVLGNNRANYVGYIPDEMFDVSYALRSLSNTFSVGDRISGREGFSEYTNEGWLGSLTHLIPNKGYAIKTTKEGILNYSGNVNFASQNLNARSISYNNEEENVSQTELDLSYLENAAIKGIEVNEQKYPFTMNLTANIASDFLDSNEEYMVVAMHNDEYRGVAKANYYNDSLVYFMTIYGNNQEDITFKLISEDDTFYNVNNSLTFSKDSFIGDVEQAKALHVSELLPINNILFIDKNPVKHDSNIIVTPFETDLYELSLFNLLGEKIATLFNGQIEAGEQIIIEVDSINDPKLIHLSSGVYLCSLNGSNTNTSIKIIIE